VSGGKTSSLSLGNWNIAEGCVAYQTNSKSLIRKHPLILSAVPVDGTKAETAASDSQYTQNYTFVEICPALS
jgi:hypothetical protein